MRTRARDQAMATIATGAAVLTGIAANLINDAAPVSIAMFGIAALTLIFALMHLSRRSHWQSPPENEQQQAALRVNLVLNAMTLAIGRRFQSESPIAIGDLPRVILRPNIKDLSLERDVSYSAFIAQIVSNPQSTLILGDPGSGKSTLLLQLARSLVDTQTLTESKHRRTVPIVLNCSSWDSVDRTFDRWMIRVAANVYRVPSSTLSYWARTGSLLVMLDGIDEVPEHGRFGFIQSVNSWLNSSHGGKLIATCRTHDYLAFGSKINHEQIAALQALSDEQVKRYVERALRSSGPKVTASEFDGLIRIIQQGSQQGKSNLRSPLLLHWLLDGLIAQTRQTRDESTPEGTMDDPGRIALDLGDQLARRNDTEGAEKAYRTALGLRSLTWSSLASVRLGLLLNRQGDRHGAQEALQQSLATYLKDTLQDPVLNELDALSPAEKAVFSAFRDSESLTEHEISSRGLVVPSACRAALRRLRDLGLLSVLEDDDTGQRRFSLVAPRSARR